jgi:hypothetical protein
MRNYLIIILAALICGCSKKGSPQTVAPPQVSISNQKTKFDPDRNIKFIQGVLKNESTNELENLTVDFNFYNDSGDKLDEDSTSIQTLAAGETWQFQTYSQMPWAKYKLNSITCWVGGEQFNLSVPEIGQLKPFQFN